MDQQDSFLENIGLITIPNLKEFIKTVYTSRVRFILLNQKDMDKLAMEYRESFRENFFEPFFLDGIYIKEDYGRSTPIGRIRIVLRR